MSEKGISCGVNTKPKSPLECLNMHIPSIDKSESQKDDLSDDEVTDVYMHIYSAEGREYTSYTTFHGMIRIFNSNTWPSVLFWCLLVLTCVVFYIYYSGSILSRYFQKHTYQETNYLTYHSYEFYYPFIFICPFLPYTFKALKDNNLTDSSIEYLNFLTWRQSDFDFQHFKSINNKSWSFDDFKTFQKTSSKTCYEIILRSSYGRREINVCADARQIETISGYCLVLNLTKSINNAKTNKDVRLLLKNHDPGGYRIYVEASSHHLLTSHFYHLLPNRKITLHAALRNSSFLTVAHGGSCISNWTQTSFFKFFHINPQLPYLMKICEHLRFSKVLLHQQGCIPSHMRHIIRTKHEICDFFNQTLLDYPYGAIDDRCYLECERRDVVLSKFGSSPLKLWNGNETSSKNISLLEMSFASRIYQRRSQVKFLQTVDVLSRIGGNTSLFFGFSCVTLMETFIFLFKSVVQLFAYQLPPENGSKLPTIIYNTVRKPSENSVASVKPEIVMRKKDSLVDKVQRRKIHQRFTWHRLHETISEKDEAESPMIATPRLFRRSVTVVPDDSAYARRRQFARERFRSSIYSLTHEQSQRVLEPCYGFRPSIDSTSFSSPLQTNRASVISINQNPSSNPRIRIVIEDPRRSSILTRYNSALGNF